MAPSTKIGSEAGSRDDGQPMESHAAIAAERSGGGDTTSEPPPESAWTFYNHKSETLRQRRGNTRDTGGSPSNDGDEETAGHADNKSKSVDEKGEGEEGKGAPQNDDDEDEDYVQEVKLSQNVFSLMFVSEANSKAHFYATCIFCVQITIVVAALLDSFYSSSGNPAQIPPGVPFEVTFAQAAVIPLAVASQNDFIEAVVRLNDRVYENVQVDLLHPSSKFINWLVASVAQLFVGIGILMCVFIFTMQSETVFQVLVNFVALFMISNISIVGFKMASNGFCGQAIWKDTLKVSEHVVRRRYKSNWVLQLLYLSCTAAMYFGYGAIVHRQRNGYYLCNAVYVQFDDTYRLNIPYLSGIYTIGDRRDRIAHRFTYVDAITEARFMVAYCDKEEAWALTHHPDSNVEQAGDPCSHLVVSQSTDSFDFSNTGLAPWRIHSERDNAFINMHSIVMQCVDCNPSSCDPDRGVCVNNICECKDGRYGIHCEFAAPCEQLVLNEHLGPFPRISSIANEDYVVLDSSYTLLKDSNGTVAMAYHRPVYVSQGYRYVMLFTGRRWAIISPSLAIEQNPNFPDLYEDELRKHLTTVLETEHLFDTLINNRLQQFVVSEAIEIGSPLDQGSPIGLQWRGMRAVRSASQPVLTLDRQRTFDSMFICAFCEDGINDCDHFGTCNSTTRTCDCPTGTVGFPLYTGALCEKTVLCTDVKRDHSDLLPTGCVGDYECKADGYCDCLDTYPASGTFCQFLPCYSAWMQSQYPGGCANNGTCSEWSGSCVCDADMFEGKYCQNAVPACYEESARLLFPPNGCANDGECINSTGFCDCDETMFSGRYCQTYLLSCSSRRIQELYPGGCDNNGTCNEATGFCACTHGIFQGKYCERTRKSCSDQSVQDIFPGGCANGGLCDVGTGFCDCEDEIFHGRYCQKFNQTSSNQTLR